MEEEQKREENEDEEEEEKEKEELAVKGGGGQRWIRNAGSQETLALTQLTQPSSFAHCIALCFNIAVFSYSRLEQWSKF